MRFKNQLAFICIAVATLLFSSCDGVTQGENRNGFAKEQEWINSCHPYRAEWSFTEYPFKQNATTPAGIPVDTQGQAMDLAILDAKTDELEQCIRRVCGRTKVPSLRQACDWAIAANGMTIEKQCLHVIVTAKAEVLKCGALRYEALPCRLSVVACSEQRMRFARCTDFSRALAKLPSDSCYCGGDIQTDGSIVVTPDLSAYRHELTHWLLRINDPLPEEVGPCL